MQNKAGRIKPVSRKRISSGASQFLSRSRSDLVMVAVAVQATVNSTKLPPSRSDG
jgi:hypothetical protein